MFLKIDQTWLAAAKAYCFDNSLETLEISHYLINFEALNLYKNKRGGKLYGFIVDNQVNALVLFNNKGVMYISNQSDLLYERVDFLKAIHREKPVIIRGTQEQIDKVFYFLQRVLKKFEFKTSYLMVAENAYYDKVSSDDIVDIRHINWLKKSQFLIEVEQYFRDHPMIINHLRSKLETAREFDFYKVIMDDENILGQVIGEFSTWQYGVIGGLYVSPKCRRRGLAECLTRYSMALYNEKLRTPVLFVEQKNVAAIALYQKMTYQVKLTMTDMSIRL